jgi:hypothetical protein
MEQGIDFRWNWKGSKRVPSGHSVPLKGAEVSTDSMRSPGSVVVSCCGEKGIKGAFVIFLEKTKCCLHFCNI